ncbi:hypothetical protein [Longimicrobium sp.]|uniref:hypothetical protein n=1 Tax=Longimicrobium sp. TaxID=2029185 RepID=UPI002E2EE387|nr:hypothetical protein [Longimicrobium sp.]HEX6039513.1 hypothetical protein [Longimicrobium sp.]
MDATTACNERPYAWYDLVGLTGDEGSRWVAEYSRLNGEMALILDAVPLLRRGRLDEGRSMLDQAWDGVRAAHVADVSVLDVAERWYLGAVGYDHYCRGEMEAADARMAGAVRAVARAVARRPFLLGLADEAVELTVHRARIARNACRWSEMHAYVDQALGMREGTVPYLELPGGGSVNLADVQGWLESLPVPAHAQPLRPHLQRPDERRRSTDRFVRDVLRLPGFVIQHP